MPTITYTPLATTTLAAAAANVTFSSISQSYRDLVCVVSGKTSIGSNSEFTIVVNADATTYYFIYMAGNGSSGSSSYSNNNYGAASSSVALATTSDQLNLKIDFLDYSATDKHKMMIVRADNSATGAESRVIRWPSNSAINSIKFSVGTGANFPAGSTFALYGIAA